LLLAGVVAVVLGVGALLFLLSFLYCRHHFVVLIRIMIVSEEGAAADNKDQKVGTI
jgi:hypothetical protein